ncbi:MAG: GIY-YIG nuclease family protein, partial [Ktedonobacteraceae bacterium]|nr:GIY-YIG nuclease family protein [Ktedonobacteraceae bacterium]
EHADKATQPQRATLLRRAHELLESIGQSTSEELLIKHLFGAEEQAGIHGFWTTLLRQTLRSSTLFAEVGAAEGELSWSFAAWRTTHQQLDEIEFVVLDTETTGLRPGSDRVIEIAGVRLRGGEAIGSFHSLVNPCRRIPPFITQFTGITQDMVNMAPTAQEVMPDFLRFIDSAIIVGHNLGFDIGFLTYEAQLQGQAFPLDGLDTLPLARRFLPDLKRFKLELVARHINISTSNFHRALNDARVTAAIFLHFLTLAKQQGIYTLGHLRRRLQLPVAWSGDITHITSAEQSGNWRADGKLSATAAVSARPTGSLFLNPAWRHDFPDHPGVYLMKDASGQVIYVGKAKCLKERLASYYNHPLGYTRKMDGLLQSVKEIETRVLGSELEALLVESQLIKALQPMYNVQLRNYDLYPFIKIDTQHPFPRVYATKEVAADGARYFGPFRSRRVVDLTIELVQKLFPLRTCTRGLPPQAKPSEPCLRLHLDRCPGPCRGGVDPAEYRKSIDQVCAFLGGEREDLLERLRRQMFEAAQNLNFERAAWLRDAIRCADEVLIGQRLITGAVEANNLFIVYPSARQGRDELFLIRHGRLVQQQRVVHEPTALCNGVREMLALARTLADAPSIVGQAEVDQINIISRWIHRHSDDRAFFPFQAALADEEEERKLIERIWVEIDAVRTLPTAMEDTEKAEGVV